MNEILMERISKIWKLDYEQRKDLAIDSILDLNEIVHANGLDKDYLTMIFDCFTRLFVAADGKLTKGEYSFYQQVTGIKVSETLFYFMLKGEYDQKYLEESLDIVKKLGEKAVDDIIDYGIALLLCENTISASAYNMLEKMYDYLGK